MNYQNLTYKESDEIGVLTLNRPEALNALNSELLGELGEFLSQRTQLRCLVITGSGEKAFVAGADIKEIDHLNPSDAKAFAKKGQQIFRQLEESSFPIIAAVNGFALGGGLELAMSCDFMIASHNAKFGLPEVTLGIMPGFGGTIRLSRYVGLGKAKQMTFTGDMISAEEAHHCGLVTEVCEQSALLERAEKLAKTIAKRGPLAVAMAKRTIQKGYDLDIDEGMDLEAKNFSELFASEDQKEGTKAFVEKRKANFTGH